MIEKRTTRQASLKQERRLEKELGGRRMPASGALSFAKDDHRVVGLVRTEAKTTRKSWYSFKPAEFVPLRRRATAAGELALFQIDLEGGGCRLAITDEPPASGISSTWETDDRSLRVQVADADGMRSAVGRRWAIELRFSGGHLPAPLTLYLMPFEQFLEDLRARTD